MKSIVIAILMVGFAAVGCAKYEVVPSTGPRAPLSAQQVKIYQDHPKKYELLGLITLAAAPEDRWDEHGDVNSGFDRLKAQAGAMGASGVLLAKDVGAYDVLVTAGYHGTFYQVPMRRDPKTIVAAAIYVIEE